MDLYCRWDKCFSTTTHTRRMYCSTYSGSGYSFYYANKSFTFRRDDSKWQGQTSVTRLMYGRYAFDRVQFFDRATFDYKLAMNNARFVRGMLMDNR
jgi:hypothetical protein